MNVQHAFCPHALSTPLGPCRGSLPPTPIPASRANAYRLQMRTVRTQNNTAGPNVLVQHHEWTVPAAALPPRMLRLLQDQPRTLKTQLNPRCTVARVTRCRLSAKAPVRMGTSYLWHVSHMSTKAWSILVCSSVLTCSSVHLQVQRHGQLQRRTALAPCLQRDSGDPTQRLRRRLSLSNKEVRT